MSHSEVEVSVIART